MRRNMFHDKANTKYRNRGNELLNDIFRRNFKLRNGWLNSKLCAKRKLLHSDEYANVFFVKETLKLVIKL